MRILYFSSRDCWPLTTGARLRDYHLARQLATAAEVTYFGLSEPGSDPEPPPAGTFAAYLTFPRGPAYRPAALLRGAAGPWPVTVLNYWSSAIAARLEALLAAGPWDTVQVEGVHLVRYLPLIRRAAPRAALVGDWHNIESEIMSRYAATASGLPRRLFARRTAGLIRASELRLLTGCDAHAVASDRERLALLERAPRARISTVPNGVDTAACAPAAPWTPGRRRIVFVGSMDYHANIDAAVWFVRSVWPLLRARMPELELSIVGRNPAPEVRALAGGGIEITGTVPDVRPFYAGALATIAPLRVGSGTRLKILEAMAAGVPVVSTTLGAEGIEAEPGRHLLIADTPEDTAAAVERLAGDPLLAPALRAAGLELVASSYDWRAVGARLLAVHRDARARTSASPPPGPVG